MIKSLSQNELKAYREFQLLDIPKEELQEIRYLFENKRL